MEKIKDNWQVVIFTAIITLVISITSSKIISRDNQVEKAASVEYVDAKDDLLSKRIDTKADTKTVDEIQQDINYTREKVDKIYLILIEKEKTR